MKWNEFRKLAETNGWQLVRHGKEHDIYRHPVKGLMQIERHGSKEIKRGLLQRLLKQVKD